MCLNDIFLVDFRNVLKIERGESAMITPYHSLQPKMRIIDIRHRRLVRFRKLHGVLLVRKR